MTQKPVVSILINNYNYSDFLADAIDSALAQTYRHFEVIVVDDGSTDGSQEIISAYGDKIISIFKDNGGQASAFNVGFEASKGDIICFLDADDIFTPRKVELIVKSLHNRSSEVGWCFHPTKLVDSTLSDLESSSEEQQKINKSFEPLEVDVRGRMARGKLGSPFVIPATSGMSFNRSCLKHILPMPVEKSIVLNDSYVKFIALGTHKGVVINNDLTLQRIHGENLFTLKENNRQQKADIFVNTAFYMKQNFPRLRNFANNLFATGLNLNQTELENTSDYDFLIKNYFSDSSFIEKARISLKVLLYNLRNEYQTFKFLHEIQPIRHISKLKN